MSVKLDCKSLGGGIQGSSCEREGCLASVSKFEHSHLASIPGIVRVRGCRRDSIQARHS